MSNDASYIIEDEQKIDNNNNIITNVRRTYILNNNPNPILNSLPYFHYNFGSNPNSNYIYNPYSNRNNQSLFNNGNQNLFNPTDSEPQPQLNYEESINNNIYSILDLIQDRILTQYENELEDVAVVLNLNDFVKLNDYIYTDIPDNKKYCMICQDQENQIYFYKRCDECYTYYHKDCLKIWLTENKVTCPNCRKDFRNQIS